MRPILDGWRLGHDQGYDSALRAAAQRLEGARLGHVWAKGAPIISSDVVERWLRDQNRKAT